ncbi:MAG: hypothetical protein KC940_01565 [Candidatus Omnitrophica bacterium]|nr:hypothetical protein [Candidatus Omnitrophota bacterium]
MNSIEAFYVQKMHELGPKERVRRGLSMTVEARNMLEKRIREEVGDLPDRQIKLLVARRLYSLDKNAQKLLDSIGDHP